jgi:MscS family membrane protein
VRFAGSSIDLEIFAYIFTAEYNDFLAVQEDLLLRIMDPIGASGTVLAIPSQIAYFAKDLGRQADAPSKDSALRAGK